MDAGLNVLKAISWPFIKILTIVPIATTSLIGCTTLTATELTNAVPAKGIVYYLPETKLEVSITRTIKKCALGKMPTVAITAKAEATVGPDVNAKYVVDYERLQSGMKHSDLAFDLYDNGTLKGVNVSVTDKSGEVLKTLTKIGIGIASIVGGSPLPVAEAPQPGTPAPAAFDCTAQVKDALAKLPNELMLLESKTDELRRQQEVVEQAKTVTDPSSTTRLATELAQRSRLQNERDLLADNVESFQAILTKNQKKLVRPSTAIAYGLVGPDEKLFTDWFTTQPPKQVEESLTVKWQAVTEIGPGGPPNDKDGLVYRQPVPGIFWLCSGGAAQDPCITADGLLAANVKKLFSSEVTLPQLGRLARLPLQNGPFQTQTLTATFSPDGALIKAGYINQSSFEKASQSALESLPSISKFLEDKKASGINDLERETKKVKAQIELEKARQEYEKLLNSSQ